jgi:hypothetical protein
MGFNFECYLEVSTPRPEAGAYILRGQRTACRAISRIAPRAVLPAGVFARVGAFSRFEFLMTLLFILLVVRRPRC